MRFALRTWYAPLAGLVFLPAALFATFTGGGDPAVIACGSSSPQYSTPPTVTVAAAGTSQSAAMGNLWNGGMADEFAAKQNIKCGSCGEEDCEMDCSYSGTISGIHYREVLNGEGQVIAVIVIAIFEGTYQIDCDNC